jgi:hypothetical protein
MSVLDLPVSGKAKAGGKAAFWLALVTGILSGLATAHPGVLSWVPVEYRVGLVSIVAALVVGGGSFAAAWLAHHLPSQLVQDVENAIGPAAEPVVNEDGHVV